MAIQPFNKFDSFSEAVAEKVHNLGSDVLMVMLVNTPAPVRANTQKSNLTEIAAGNGYTANGIAATISSSAQSSGTYKLVLADVQWTATGAMAAFRYAVLYNFTATNKELIGWWDNGVAVSLTAGQTFTVDFDPSAGVLTLV